MRRVLFALLAELIPAAAFIVIGGGILAGADFAAEPAALLAGLGVASEVSGWLLLLSALASMAATLWRMVPLVRQLWLSKALAENGLCRRGVVADIRSSRTLRVNQTTSVRLTIRCTAPSGREIEFISPVLWAPEIRVGDGVDVIFDPADEARYFIRLREKPFVRDSLKDTGRKSF